MDLMLRPWSKPLHRLLPGFTSKAGGFSPSLCNAFIGHFLLSEALETGEN